MKLTATEASLILKSKDYPNLDLLPGMKRGPVSRSLKEKGALTKAGKISAIARRAAEKTPIKKNARMAQAKAAAEKHGFKLFDNSEDVGEFQVTIRTPKNKNVDQLHELKYRPSGIKTKSEFWANVIEQIDAASRRITVCNGHSCNQWRNHACKYWNGTKPTGKAVVAANAASMAPDATRLVSTAREITELLESTGLERSDVCEIVGLTEITLKNYIKRGKWPYSVQFSIECLAHLAWFKRAGIDLPKSVVMSLTPDPCKHEIDNQRIKKLISESGMKTKQVGEKIGRSLRTMRLYESTDGYPYHVQFAIEHLAKINK